MQALRQQGFPLPHPSQMCRYKSLVGLFSWHAMRVCYLADVGDIYQLHFSSFCARYPSYSLPPPFSPLFLSLFSSCSCVCIVGYRGEGERSPRSTHRSFQSLRHQNRTTAIRSPLLDSAPLHSRFLPRRCSCPHCTFLCSTHKGRTCCLARSC